MKTNSLIFYCKAHLILLFLSCILIKNKTFAQCKNVALGKPATATGIVYCADGVCYTKDKAFDGDCGTNWNSGKWPVESIQVDLQQTYSIEKIIFRPCVKPNGNETYKIYTSTDMSTWTVVDNDFTINVTSGQYITRSYAASPLTNVRGVKLECTDGPSWTCFFEIGIYEAQTSVNATISPSGPIICKGDSILLSASGGSQYLWNTGETTQSIYVKQGTYSVIVSSPDCLNNSCSDTAYVTVNVDTVIATIAPYASICKGDNVTLSASGGNSYLWNTGDTTSSIIISPDSSGTFSVIVSDSSCSDTAITDVTINQLPTANAGNDITLCPNSSTQLNASGGTSYQWTPTQGLSSNTVANPVATPSLTTDYIVKVTDNNLCTSYDTVRITVDTSLNARFTPDDLTGYVPLSVDFNNTSTGGSLYEWTFGDADSSTLLNPAHIYTSAGNYAVRLIVLNSTGCRDTAYGSIRVQESGPELWVPNAFTPDEDGLNEIFGVYSVGITEFKGIIFDRWGELIYEWEDAKGGWDGTYKGKKVQEGVYVYTITATGVNDVIYKKQGHVTVLRK